MVTAKSRNLPNVQYSYLTTRLSRSAAAASIVWGCLACSTVSSWASFCLIFQSGEEDIMSVNKRKRYRGEGEKGEKFPSPGELRSSSL